jgi:peptide chain release factor 2
MAESGFWNDRQDAEQASRQSRSLKTTIESWDSLRQQLQDFSDLHQMAIEEEDDSAFAEIEAELPAVLEQVADLEFRTVLSDPDDPKSAILEIHSGAGGTEAADWAAMLMRMYSRWIEQSGFKSDIMDLQSADEAGIKSVTIEVSGEYAYGYLKAEIGVHRLVRISPFDAGNRRHTSFASVFAYPEVENEVEVDLKDEDLQIEVYRAGGAGGQHVNKTSSAVRMTHIPTGITVQCQNERSQFKNKGTARKVLAARLYQHYRQQEQVKLDAVQSTKKSIDFGSQIRSYVFHPYNLVKDHRTDHETSGVQAVMDGQIDDFIKAYLTHATSS